MSDDLYVIAGSSGFIGQALCAHWQREGISFVRLVRRSARTSNESSWDPERGQIDEDLLERASLLVNLSGVNLADRYWTRKQKEIILSSRLDSTRCLIEGLQNSGNKTCRFLNASGIGYYGDSEEMRFESSGVGSGFLADVCSQWESGLGQLDDSHHAVALRCGVVLGIGGALDQMLAPMRWGFAGRLGHGRQWMSWISLRDLLAAIDFIIAKPELSGAINLVSPEPMRNHDFMKTIAREAHCPFWAHVPAWALRLRFGQMANEVMLTSVRVCPRLLQDHGFSFSDTDLGSCIRSILGAIHA